MESTVVQMRKPERQRDELTKTNPMSHSHYVLTVRIHSQDAGLQSYILILHFIARMSYYNSFHPRLILLG